jgi:hypothetical protein
MILGPTHAGFKHQQAVGADGISEAHQTIPRPNDPSTKRKQNNISTPNSWQNKIKHRAKHSACGMYFMCGGKSDMHVNSSNPPPSCAMM